MKAKRHIAPRRRRTPEEAKFEIVQVARKFLSKQPFRELTVGKLMERTQIGRSAFYAYFTDVYDLARDFRPRARADPRGRRRGLDQRRRRSAPADSRDARQRNHVLGNTRAADMSVALNRFNLVYLTDRFGGARHPRDRRLILSVLERIWLGTLYGPRVTDTRADKQARRARAPNGASVGYFELLLASNATTGSCSSVTS